MRWGWMTMMAALALAGCVEVPACVDDGTRDGSAVCGTGERSFSLTTYEVDGVMWLAFPSCDDAWRVACDSAVEYRPPSCASGTPVCPSGAAPMCMHVPCDGQEHTGPGYVAP